MTSWRALASVLAVLVTGCASGLKSNPPSAGDAAADTYRAFDRFPKNDAATRFFPEDAPPRAVRSMVRYNFGENLMPADDWILIYAPMSGVRAAMAERPNDSVRAVYRMAEIPQDHSWMAESKGRRRTYVVYEQGRSMADTLLLLTNDGREVLVPVWRGGKPPEGGPQ